MWYVLRCFKHFFTHLWVRLWKYPGRNPLKPCFFSSAKLCMYVIYTSVSTHTTFNLWLPSLQMFMDNYGHFLKSGRCAPSFRRGMGRYKVGQPNISFFFLVNLTWSGHFIEWKYPGRNPLKPCFFSLSKIMYVCYIHLSLCLLTPHLISDCLPCTSYSQL